jgi:predicted enzyme related to lactoylglutathione lyase
MNRVIHFEIQAAEPERAARFYTDVFGWEIKEWVIPGVPIKNENRYWNVSTGGEKEPGINGGLIFRRGPAPAGGEPVNAYVCTVGVTSVDESVLKVQKAGGTVVVPKMPIPGVGWVSYCKDTEGNILGIHQEDTNAK